jgi:hypothetical protein
MTKKLSTVRRMSISYEERDRSCIPLLLLLDIDSSRILHLEEGVQLP